jgi:Tfp pilus assembly protein PilN
MLRTNLATRPFYNERIVHLGLLLLTVASLILLLVGGVRFRALASEHATLTATAEQEEQQADEVRAQTVALQRGTGKGEIELLRTSAVEANRLIDQRVFSWTEFLNLIEATLPSDVRLTALTPNVDAGDVTVSIGVIGRNVMAIFAFIEQLEATGAFADVIPSTEEITDDGMYRTILIGRYVQLSRLDDEPGIETESAVTEPAE